MNLEYRIKLINNYMLNEGILKLPSGIHRPKDLETESRELYESNPTHGVPLEWENFKVGEGRYYYSLRKGEITLISGIPSCIAEDTHINFTARVNGKTINSKGGSIKKLYKRFHNIDSHMQTNVNAKLFIGSIDEHDKIIQMPIANVVKCGRKLCYEITTKNGRKLQATPEHKFYVGNNKYKKLEQLDLGDFIYSYSGGYIQSKTKIINRKAKYVKYYPNKSIKIIDNRYKYHRVEESWLHYESYINNFSFDDYIRILNTESKGFIDKLYHIPYGYQVHHKDHNHTNNHIDNLELLTASEHSTYHGKYSHSNNLGGCFCKVTADEIVGFKSVGYKETYDIMCYQPYNNFLANNIVVHNSGKSTFLDSIVTHTIKTNGWKWAIFSPESGTPTHMLKRLIENITGEMYSSRLGKRITWSDVNRAIDALNRFVYILEPKDVNIDSLLAISSTLHSEFGLNALILDPYNEMSHTRPKELNETEYVSMMLGKVRRFCQKTDIHFFCVAHPNKQGSRGDDGGEKPPNAIDISGSMNFYNKADNVLIIHRNKDVNSNRHHKVDVHIKKIRFRETGELGTVSLFYNTKTGRLDDIPTVTC